MSVLNYHPSQRIGWDEVYNHQLFEEYRKRTIEDNQVYDLFVVNKESRTEDVELIDIL